MGYKKSSNIKDNEILVDVIYINDIEFRRYYHNLKIPTRYFVSFYGNVYSEISDKILIPNLTLKGYECYNVFINYKNKSVSCHKMVGLAFHGDKYVKGYDMDHLDGNKRNNRADNLEWVTRQENIIRAFRNGLKHGVRGDKNPVTVYKDADIIKACELIKSGRSIIETADITNIPKSYLYTIIRGESRKHIVSRYNFDRSIYKINHTPPLDKNTKESILNLYYKHGYRPMEIADKLGIDNNDINKVYNFIYDNKNYK